MAVGGTAFFGYYHVGFSYHRGGCYFAEPSRAAGFGDAEKQLFLFK